MEHLKIDYSKLQIGQRVYCLLNGWGVIDSLKNEADYPIKVLFDNDGINAYTKRGFYFERYLNPSLYLSNPFEENNQERVIEVKDDYGNWYKRVLIKIVGKNVVCWESAETIEKSKNIMQTNCWRIWRELQPEPLTQEERITELEKEVAELKKQIKECI